MYTILFLVFTSAPKMGYSDYDFQTKNKNTTFLEIKVSCNNLPPTTS